MLTYAIIPARSGSKGVPDKNIRPLLEHPLLAWSIAAAKQCTSIERVIVSTDNQRYAEIARHYGAEAPFLRPPEISGDSSPDRDFLRHATQWLLDTQAYAPDYWVHLRPTTPLRQPAIIESAIMQMQQSPTATSLRSAHEASESPAKWFAKKANCFIGLMGNEFLNLPRQQCPVAYVPNGYVDIVRAKRVLGSEDVYFPQMLAFITEETPEVDTMYDFEKLEFLVSKGHPILAALNMYKPFKV